MNNKLEKLNKLLEVMKDDVVSPKEIEKFLVFVLGIIQKSKESMDSMSSEHMKKMCDMCDYIEEEHAKFLVSMDEKDVVKEQEFNSKLSEVKSLLEEIKKIEVKDGEDGKDADEEIIVEKVLAQIKLPEYKETVLDDGAEIVAKINDLDINDDDLKIDASHIKNLPKFENTKANGGGWRNLFQLHDIDITSVADGDILQYDSDTSTWKNVAADDPTSTMATVSANSTTTAKSLYTMTSTIPVEFRSSDGNSLLYLNETSEYIRVGVSALTEKFSISGANNDTFGILRVHSTGGALPNAGISLTTDVSGSGYRNWQIATNYSTGGTFEILRSTSNGGNPTTNAFTISSAGNVGIGTTAPSNQLHLYTNTAVAGTTGIKIENIATNGYANISFTTDAGTAQFVASGSTYSNGALRGSAFNVYSPGANGIVLESAHATGQLQIVTGGNAASNIRMTVDQNGLVGIGTTAPVSKLHISTGVDTDSGVIEMVMGGSNGANARTGRIIKDTTTAYTMIIRSGDYAGTGLGSNLRFQTNNGDGDRMTILGGTGAIAIGGAATTTTYDGAVGQVAILSAKSIGTFNSQLNLVDSTAQTTGVGGGLTLIGKYTDAGAYAVAGGIYAQKTNSTTGSYSFDIAFNARQSGNSPTQVMNLSALNNMGGLKIGRSTTFTPIKTLDIAGDISFDDVAEPSQSGFTAALAGAGAGNVNNGQHYYAVEFYTATGVTGAVTPVVNVTVTDLTTNGQVDLASLPVSTDPRVIGRRIYRTIANDTSAFAYYLAAIANNTTTTYRDNIADSSLDLTDRVYRKTNTTAGRFYVNSTLMLQTTDLFHTFVGVSAGASNTRGDSVVFVGGNAGNANTTGSNNTFIGYTAGSNNTTGSSNDTVGYASQLNQTTGSLNVSMGENTLRLSSAGGVTGNTAIGAGSLYQLTASSDYNTALGYRAGGGFRGDYNIHIGADAGYISTPASIGDYNINIGYQTGRAHGASADNNILIGKALELQSSTGDNQLSIGNLIFGTGVQGTGTTVSTGNIGIAVAAPSARLHLAAGATGASTAPLKFTTGTLLTSPEAGAVEFLTDAWYGTITTGAARKTFAFTDSAMAIPSHINLNAPEGFLINGKIVPSVASNDLTVAIKGMDGNDPSTTNPVYCRINGVVRSITAALSVTKNDGTNWFNSGSTELGTQEIDYFVYLGYNATDGVVIGFSRIPYACQYSDFSATTTNEKYAAISNITTAASTDYYHVIGRFAATLSLTGTGHLWTVPTFTAINLIQRPIYETRSLVYTATFATVILSGYDYVFYKITNNSMQWGFKADNRNLSGSSGAIQVKLPMASTTSFGNLPVTNLVGDGTNFLVSTAVDNAGAIYVYKTQAAGNWAATETGVYVRLNTTLPL